MTCAFDSHLGRSLSEFLRFKRSLGCSYRRAEFSLRRFERFVVSHPDLGLDRLIDAYLAGFDRCKPVTIVSELAVLRQLCRFLRRRNAQSFIPSQRWTTQSKESSFLPYVFSPMEIRLLLDYTRSWPSPPFRARTLRVLILVLYCTGLRFGEAVRLRLADVDLRRRVFFVAQSKGRARWVPFGSDLARAITRYTEHRRRLASQTPSSPLFVQADGRGYPVQTASTLVRKLLRRIGLKPRKGRVGPRPYDFRHTFAVHRLTRWYRQRVDLHARLPLLSAYMGHDNILGTEVYLSTTPELLQLAGNRFAARLHRKVAR